jgi:hypothetical protein
MSVSAIGPASGTTGVTGTTTSLHRAQQKLTADLAAKAAAAKVLAADRNAVARAQQAAEEAQAVAAAQRAIEQQVLPAAPTPQQQSKPVTASASALGGSFDVTV